MSDLSQGYGGYGALDEKRIRAGAYGNKTQTLGPGLHRGFSTDNASRNSNIVSITPKPIAAVAVRNVVEGRSFNLGDRVFHDSYGEGEVQAIRVLRERQLVDVRFGAGRTVSFFSDVAPLEKLGND
jgi:DNA helicase-2/ATP-dependent DNA helicase PcrA